MSSLPLRAADKANALLNLIFLLENYIRVEELCGTCVFVFSLNLQLDSSQELIFPKFKIPPCF